MVSKQVEQQVIEQLTGYRDIVGRLRVLETYSVGNGITVSRLNEDDHLQELHQKLRGLPSYMYLTQYEQKLETAANAYLASHPAGTKAQLRAVQNCNPLDEEDAKNLRDLQNKIRKVIKARTGVVDGYEAILEQLAEYQDLKAEKEKIDRVLEVMGQQESHLADLLRLRYIEGLPVVEVAAELGVVRRTLGRWRVQAIETYSKLIGMS
ncbi:RNA polymerase sigma factor, sigma-70 family [Paenibacillus larvae subsp. larvae]|uniref:RNA polymerase sigma factor, sigma-70 family n=4 Tax=Paenibacillus larvae TaxID=1464 RepID=A0A2L1U4Z0_9BACL|nr:sigma-70 family RNA polymerase sigma factor [Paenibacillus larvae]AQT84300.1 RNA polymerase subunit sigma-24 [Paenibacillus larvae subsp. pulvifaciens]AQZ46282.1 RNA polymerase subunit sigma-24 [Paenibacillus larvae subsp. pulvifaciens]AVF27961.1 RNA polymerase sigma factor, sigma-70 family [Paenibacillus larvae subsp. larvae]AVF32463.1 RNA polymerase sigma factor, sigma-70 family [Paenibacillus larvae subsp. larvae]MBH0344148.1 RNA polymerase subunit sigma-24 [Paenibacillus larvae]